MKQPAFCVSHLAMLSKLFRWSGAHRSLCWVAELPGRCLVTCCRSTQTKIACTVGLHRGSLGLSGDFCFPWDCRGRGLQGSIRAGACRGVCALPSCDPGRLSVALPGASSCPGEQQRATSRRMLGSGAGRTSVTKLWGWCSQCCSCKNPGEQKKGENITLLK